MWFSALRGTLRPTALLPTPRFEDVTETTGVPVTEEAARMMYARYVVAADLSEGRRVLELGCGGGNGLGLVGARARSLVGGDYSRPLTRAAKAHYGARFPLVRLSADHLPFRTASFDVVLFFEATYYVSDMDSAFQELGRVTAPGGTVLLVNANPERPDFVRSPHSVRYHAADEFRTALEGVGFRVTVEGAFPVDPPSTGRAARFKRVVVGLVRRALEALHLVPRTLRGRARLKRLVYGKLREVPPELPEGFAEVEARARVPPGPVPNYKVIYVTGTKRGP